MKKNVRNIRALNGGGAKLLRAWNLIDLWKLRPKLDLAACDLHGARPFLPAKRDPDHMLAWREGDVRRRVAEEFAVNVDFAAAR